MAKKEDKQPRVKTVQIEFHDDEHLELAARLAKDSGTISTSLIQRRFTVGYARAAHLIDRLEELKVILPQDGAKPRRLSGPLPIFKRKKPPQLVGSERKAKNKGGRPTVYSDEIVFTICTRLSHGESLRQICKDEDMPGMSTIIDWLNDPLKENFHKQYERARALQAEIMFDEIIEISDDSTNDWVDREVGKDRIIRSTDHEHVQRSKLRVDSRKWYLSKVLPKKYGEKLDVTSGGKQIKQPRPAQITYVVPEKPKEKK
jgi:hypothetical protein